MEPVIVQTCDSGSIIGPMCGAAPSELVLLYPFSPARR